jgi:hypothetical protein
MAAFIHVRSQKYYPPRFTSHSEDYHKLYRFSEENVQCLGEHFLGHNEETRGGSLSSKTRMQIFLRFLSDPESQRGFVKEEGAHRLTINKIITNVLP